MELEDKKCIPCEGGVAALTAAEANRLLGQLAGWRIEGAAELRKSFKFASFPHTIAFVNRMASLAEAEGHHPDFCVRFTVLEVSLTTHAIGGLSANDFVLAAKIDALAGGKPEP
ncbi:MAG: 4a-hydroxytetrahydrobiopterin dehydratase [Polyangia bacterium]|jgi:4a-hydroxytetrahydrobiopterin dehydratase